jgi:two-component system, LytTR family, response regulator LytT
METGTSLNLAELEFVKTNVLGHEFSSDQKSISKEKLLHLITEAAILLSNKLNDLKPHYQKRFLVTSGQNIKSIAIEKVAYFLSDGRYSKMVTHNKEQYLLDQSLESLTQKLDPTLFYRVNRQTIVSYQSIQNMIVWSKSRIKLDLSPAHKNDVIVSIDNSGAFKKWLNK